MNFLHAMWGRFARILPSLVAAVALFGVTQPATAAIFSIVDEQGVSYDIVRGTHNVVVSADNAWIFNTVSKDIVIPATVTDVSTNLDEEVNNEYTVVGIAPKAFSETKITSFTLTAELDEIPDSCFYWCKWMTKVVLPSSMRKIGNHAFNNCYNLTDFTIPEEIKTIGVYSFYNTRIPSVDLPNLTEVPSYAFAENSKLLTAKFGDELKKIDDNAFNSCSGMTSIDFGNSLETIGDKAFYYCSKLVFPTIPASCTYWGTQSFASCNALGAVVIPQQVSMAGENFYNSTVTSITWPADSIDIGTGKTFYKVKNISTVPVPAWMTHLTNIYGESTNIKYITLPKGVEVIEPNALYRLGLTVIVFPDGFKRLCARGINSCNALSSITFKEGMTVETAGFYKSKDVIQYMYFPENPMIFEENPFESTYDTTNTKYTTVVIPNWMTEIPNSFLRDFTRLATITFHDNVKKIGDYAFYNNYVWYYNNMTLPSSLEWIGNNAFNQPSNSRLQSLDIPASVYHIGDGAFSGTAIKTLTIPGTLLEYKGAFRGCPSLNTVTIAEGQTKVDTEAFYSCAVLQTVNLSSTVTEIGNSAFYKCVKLAAPTFPAGLKRIGNYAFSECYVLSPYSSTYLTLPGGTTIGNYAFYGAGIASLEFPEEKIEFGEGALSRANIYYIKSAEGLHTLPAWLDSIPKYFMRNNPFEHLVMGGNVKHVADEAFAMSLVDGIYKTPENYFFRARRQTTLPENPCTWGKDVFRNTAYHRITFPEWMTVVPEGFCSADPNEYKENDEGPEGALYVEPIIVWNNIERIEDRAFQWQMIEGFNLTDKINYIGKDAFRNAYVCWTLAFYQEQKETHPGWEDTFILTLGNPEGVKIGDDAFTEASIREIRFAGCDELSDQGVFRKIPLLKKVTLAECMTAIPNNLLSGCENLEDVTISSKTSYIGDNAFLGCKNLKTIQLPETIDYIGAHAFDLAEWGSVDYHSEVADYNKNFTELVWPEHKIGYLHDEAFAGLGVESLRIPSWMDHLPNFRGFMAMKSVTWDDRSGRTDCDSITGIGFSECRSLTTFDLPSNVPVNISGTGFRNCSALTSITGGEQLCGLSYACFENCSELVEVPNMNAITYIPDKCFSHTSKLVDLQIGPNVEGIGGAAFALAGVPTIHLTDKCQNLGGGCFSESCFEEITIPGSILKLPEYCFSKSFTKNITVEEGVSELGKEAFKEAVGLENIKLPSTIHDIRYQTFYTCKNLKTFNSRTDSLDIGWSAFEGCNQLEEFRVKGAVHFIDFEAFYNCKKLKNFVIESGESVDSIAHRSFQGCTSLEHFPYLKNADIYWNAFEECSSLIEATFPLNENFLYRARLPFNQNGWSSSWTTHWAIFASCSSLQSLTWPDDDHYFDGRPDQYYGNASPLQALSYVYDTQLIPYDYDHPERPYTIKPFTRYGNRTDADGNVYFSPLMVRRNEKWKFHQTKYDYWFDIREMKEPTINLTGSVWSEYNAANNTNHYKVRLMWDLALSDLNEKGETDFTVYRDEEPVATLKFLKPNFEATHPDLGDVVEVDVEVHYADGRINTDNTFKGDFDFPIEVDGDTIFQAAKSFQWNQMHYDRTTHKRLASFDKYGYYPWFIFVDEFDSDVLSEKDAPKFYTYKVKMNSYGYKKPVNNKNCELDADGMRYHYVDTITGDVWSKPTRLYPTMSMPSLEFEGLYSEADILADRDLYADNRIAPTSFEYVNSFDISYKVDPKIAKMKGRLPNGEIIPLVEWVEVREVRKDDNGKDYTVAVTDQFPVDYGTDFVANLPEGLQLDASKRYITVTGSTFRGKTGSLVMSVPEPLTYTAKVTKHEYTGHQHDGFTMHSVVDLKPVVNKMGYGDTPLSANDYYVGIWRHYSLNGDQTLSLAPLRAGEALADGELVHHCGSSFSATDCNECSPYVAHDADGNITFHDYMDVELNTPYSVAYTTRMYVKVPESVIPGEARYMLAEAVPDTTGQILSGVEDVIVDTEEADTADDADEKDYRYFDLQGRAIAAPIPGEPCIRISPTGAKKLIK